MLLLLHQFHGDRQINVNVSVSQFKMLFDFSHIRDCWMNNFGSLLGLLAGVSEFYGFLDANADFCHDFRAIRPIRHNSIMYSLMSSMRPVAYVIFDYSYSIVLPPAVQVQSTRISVDYKCRRVFTLTNIIVLYRFILIQTDTTSLSLSRSPIPVCFNRHAVLVEWNYSGHSV